MAGRKLTKYERMWRTRRRNSSAKLVKIGLSPLEGKTDVVRTSTKRLKAGAKMARIQTNLLFDAARGRDVPPAFQPAPESFVIVTDSLGRGVMVNTRDIMRAAEVIKQTGYVE